MTDEISTPLDRAHAAMQTAGDAGYLAFYHVMADTLLTVWLQAEAEALAAQPKVVTLDEGDFVLAFDTEDRLAELAGAAAPVMSLPGRALAAMLDGQGVGIALNLGAAPSAMLVPPDAVHWLVQTLLDAAPDKAGEMARATGFAPPPALGAALMDAIAQKLAPLARQAEAWLVTGHFGDGTARVLLVVSGVSEEMRPRLADAVGEALVFSGSETQLDVTVLDDGSAALEPIRAVGARLVIEPATTSEQVLTPAAPGMNPDRPPRLR